LTLKTTKRRRKQCRGALFDAAAYPRWRRLHRHLAEDAQHSAEIDNVLSSAVQAGKFGLTGRGLLIGQTV
jgi:hypothetical protein